MTAKKNKARYCSVAALRYAKVLHELSIKEDIILDMADTFEKEPKLLDIFQNPVISGKKKHTLIERIFPKEIHSFLKVVADCQKTGIIPEIIEAYEDQKNKMSGTVKAQLKYVVLPLREQLDRMEEFIKHKYNVDGVQWEMLEDKTLIGGFILNVEGKEYDYSIEGRLKRLEQKLTRR